MLSRLLKAIMPRVIGWERCWKYRHWVDPKWVEGYKNLKAPHRKVLVKEILKHNPQSVLEVGCGAGANLFLLHEASPRLHLYGIDISPRAVKEGNKWNGDIATITLGSFDDIPYGSLPISFSVAFTDTSLMYAKDKVKALKELKRVAKKVILYEWETLMEVL